MFKLVMCHRIQTGIPNRDFHERWKEARRALAIDLQPVLGFSSYGQTHQSSRCNLVYLSVLFSRSRLVVSLFGAKGPPPQKRPIDGERFDVTDEFEFASRDAMVRAVLSEAGAAAARRLAEDQARFASRTSIVTSDEYVAAPDPAPQPIDLRTNFFLRSRPELSREQMLAYWGESHKRLVLSLQGALNYRAYNQLHVRSAPDLKAVAERLGGSAGDEFDGVAELCFTSQGIPLSGIFSPRTESANLKLVKDESNFIDHPRSVLVYGNHYRLFGV